MHLNRMRTALANESTLISLRSIRSDAASYVTGGMYYVDGAYSTI